MVEYWRHGDLAALRAAIREHRSDSKSVKMAEPEEAAVVDILNNIESRYVLLFVGFHICKLRCCVKLLHS